MPIKITDNMTDLINRVESVSIDIADETYKAIDDYPPFHSAHEGWAVIEEESIELRDEIFIKQGERDWGKMRHEAIQTAAMCLRLIVDIIDPNINGEQTGND